ncbi:MAG: hypothetical protein WCT44_01855 [Candidatus Paceibacterota bacterium]
MAPNDKYEGWEESDAKGGCQLGNPPNDGQTAPTVETNDDDLERLDNGQVRRKHHER